MQATFEVKGGQKTRGGELLCLKKILVELPEVKQYG